MICQRLGDVDVDLDAGEICPLPCILSINWCHRTQTVRNAGNDFFLQRVPWDAMDLDPNITRIRICSFPIGFVDDISPLRLIRSQTDMVRFTGFSPLRLALEILL